MVETAPIDRALGAIGTAFRLSRLYPATHPAVTEALRLVADAVAGLAGRLPVVWSVGVQGLHAQGQALVPRNAQVSELAGLLYARGIRTIELAPGLLPEHVLALCGVAGGHVDAASPALGRITLGLGRRTARPPDTAPRPPRRASARATPGITTLAGVAAPGVLDKDALPADVAARRASQALRAVDDVAQQRDAADQLSAMAPSVLELHDPALVAETIAALDAALLTATDEEVVAAIDRAAEALTQDWVIARLVQRLGEPRVPAAERAAVVRAVGALAAVATDLVVDAYRTTAAELREPYRAAIRAAADRALEPLERRAEDSSPEAAAVVAEFLGLTGSGQAVPRLGKLARHDDERVREAALLALAELGGRSIARIAVPSLRDDSPIVRTAAAKAMGVTGDASAVTLLVRRAHEEEDEGVQVELLAALGGLGGKEALDALAEFAEPGGLLRRRTPFVRAAAMAALGALQLPEARALLALYSQDRELSVRRAAEAAMQ